MNKKVFISMLTLSVIFLVGLYVFKIFFPQEFMMSIQSEKIIQICEFIDNHKWANILFGFGIGIVFDYFYFGAVCRQKILNWKLLLIIIFYGIGLNCYYNFVPVNFIANNSTLIMAISSCYMILVPIFFTNELKPLAITYCANFLSQSLFIVIRNITMISANTTSLTTFLFALDNYLWIICCYLIFNMKEKEN